MRRLIGLLLVIAASAAANAQVWEKLLSPGLTFRMDVDAEAPRVVYSLRWDLHAKGTHANPELGQGKVFGTDPSKGRETLPNMVRRTGAIAGINADFFPFTGDPVGLMVRQGQLISQPYPSRSEFGWGDNAAYMKKSGIALSFKAGGETIPIDDINSDCKDNAVTLDTEICGIELAHTPNIAAVLKVVQGDWTPNGKVQCEITGLQNDAEKVAIQPGEALLIGAGTRAAPIANLRPGDRITISSHVTGFDWSKIQNVVGGGPILLKGGVTAVDGESEGFKKDFTDKRHARSAVGRTADGNVVFAVVENRVGVSVGATLDELADVMRKLGCVDAMNLDGGGSSTLNIFGATLNKPSEEGQRPIANGVLFFGPDAKKDPDTFTLKGSTALTVGESTTLHVMRSNGEEVPTSEVIWAADGPAWIDQGGTLHTLADGNVNVHAYVHGNLVTQIVAIAKAG